MTVPNVNTRKKISSLSRTTRKWRKVHHIVGLSVAALLLISAVTGILLAFKKDVDLLQPPTQSGIGSSLEDWQPLAALEEAATEAISTSVSGDLTLDRIDVRPEKGIAKFLFQPGAWEVQLDGSNGKILSVEKRYSDIIESIHDGSIINDLFKLLSMNILGWGVVLMIITGFWLWFGPWKIRKIKKV